MKPAELQQHITDTYFSLRLGMAVVAIALPFVLWIGGHVLAHVPLQKSMSAYYHVDAVRDWFVGLLFAIAASLYFYKGYSVFENYALNLAAILLAGVAVFPSATEEGAKVSLHGVCAVSFFACIAYVAIFRAHDTLSLIADGPAGEARKKRYRRVYKLLGIGMIVFPVIGVILSSILQWGAQQRSPVFFVEAAGVLLFAAYWLVKRRELESTNAEQLALAGKVQTPPHRTADVFRTMPVDGPKTSPAH